MKNPPFAGFSHLITYARPYPVTFIPAKGKVLPISVYEFFFGGLSTPINT
jgi:hypothetical protein